MTQRELIAPDDMKHLVERFNYSPAVKGAHRELRLGRCCRGPR